MAARYDVAGRLAEGLAAVDDVQTYVSAAQTRGYANADLTLHGGQVRERYGAEDGMNLHLLDADCAALRAVAETADEALRAVRDQAVALEHAWTGSGGGAAAEFLRRHGLAGAEVAETVRRAAEACATLRDQLWDVVDRKVNATVTIDDRTRSQRPGWLTAARAVIAGAQDDTSADTIDSQVTPFVDNDVRGEWISAMRSATAAAAAAYWVAIDTLDSRTGVRFEVPGDLGPRYIPPVAAAAAGAVPAAAAAVRPAAATTVDDAWPVDSAPPSTLAAPPLPPAAAAPPAPAELPTSAPGLASLPSLGGGGPGGGLPDMGGLLGDLFGGPTDAPALDPLPDSLPDNDNEIDEPDPEDPDEDTEDTEDTEVADGTETPAEEPADDCETDEKDPEPAPGRVVAPALAPAAPPPAPLAAPADSTPCEIAANELPQVGQ
ncbi:hypothetical protein BH09ACT8_BH09ACT8_25360 [soil metagenome]